jgi:hypothetical protein
MALHLPAGGTMELAQKGWLGIILGFWQPLRKNVHRAIAYSILCQIKVFNICKYPRNTRGNGKSFFRMNFIAFHKSASYNIGYSKLLVTPDNILYYLKKAILRV